MTSNIYKIPDGLSANGMFVGAAPDKKPINLKTGLGGVWNLHANAFRDYGEAAGASGVF